MYSFINKLKSLLDKPDIEEIAAYQHKMPQSIEVTIKYDKKTGFYTAQVTQLDNKKTRSILITESRTEDKLVNMVNDLVLTYLDFPERIKHNMPKLLPVDINFADARSKNNKMVFAK